MSSDQGPSIKEALAQFLADQRARLAPRTYRNYEYVVELLSDSLNGYGYQSLGEWDRKRWEKAFDAGANSLRISLAPEAILSGWR